MGPRGDNRTGTEQAGAGPEPQEAHPCPPTAAAALEGGLTPRWGHSSCPRFSSLGCGTEGPTSRGVWGPIFLATAASPFFWASVSPVQFGGGLYNLLNPARLLGCLVLMLPGP